MNIVLITGGARSGKSRHAEGLATEFAGEGGRVTYLATAVPGDAEMERRIAHHRARRPAAWETLEVPPHTDEGLLGRASHSIILLDCLTLLLTRAIFRTGAGAEELTENQVELRAREAVDALLDESRRLPGTLLVVTNEVGMGIVPEHPLGRWFRDAQGRANQRVAAAAAQVVFMVSGIPWIVKG